jgi:hypothetical protein
MKPDFGTRYELLLESSEGSERAIYRAIVHRPEGQFQARVQVTGEGAQMLEAPADLDTQASTQLLALAKTIGKRADASPWPRRLYRWRQPGVR